MSETPPRDRAWKSVSAVAIALVLGMALLWLGVPRLVAAFLMLPGDSTLSRLQEQQAIAPNELETVIESRAAALRWVSSGRLYTDRALGRLLQEEGTGPGAQAKNSSRFDQAIRDLKAGLAVAPADPYAWARLALAKHLVDGPSPEVASALVMSLLTGPYEPDMIPLRLELAFENWAHLPQQDRELIDQQVRYAWSRSKKRLLRMAREPERLAVIRAALAKDPRILAAFEKRFSKLSR